MPSPLAVDTETTGVEFGDYPFLVSMAWDTGGGNVASIALDVEKSSQEIAERLCAAPCLIFHNAKFDLRMLIVADLLKRDDLTPDRIEDTECLAHLLDEHRPKGLKALAVSELGWKDTVEVPLVSDPTRTKIIPREDHELAEVRKELGLKKGDGYHLLPRENVIPYALRDAEFTYRLWRRFRTQLPDDMLPLYAQEMALTLVLLDVEMAGLGVDDQYVDEQIKHFAKSSLSTELKIRKMVGDDEFNPNSPKQLLEAFHARGLEVSKTDKKTLATIDDPLVGLIKQLREEGKMLSTYFTAIRDERVDGILHPNYRQHAASTGRMGSGKARNN